MPGRGSAGGGGRAGQRGGRAGQRGGRAGQRGGRAARRRGRAGHQQQDDLLRVEGDVVEGEEEEEEEEEAEGGGGESGEPSRAGVLWRSHPVKGPQGEGYMKHKKAF